MYEELLVRARLADVYRDFETSTGKLTPPAMARWDWLWRRPLHEAPRADARRILAKWLATRRSARHPLAPDRPGESGRFTPAGASDTAASRARMTPNTR